MLRWSVLIDEGRLHGSKKGFSFFCFVVVVGLWRLCGGCVGPFPLYEPEVKKVDDGNLQQLEDRMGLYSTAYLAHASDLRRDKFEFHEGALFAGLTSIVYGGIGNSGTALYAGGFGAIFAGIPLQYSYAKQAANYEMASKAMACLAVEVSKAQSLPKTGEGEKWRRLYLAVAKEKLREVRRKLHDDQAKIELKGLEGGPILSKIVAIVEQHNKQKEMRDQSGEDAAQTANAVAAPKSKTSYSLQSRRRMPLNETVLDVIVKHIGIVMTELMEVLKKFPDIPEAIDAKNTLAILMATDLQATRTKPTEKENKVIDRVLVAVMSLFEKTRNEEYKLVLAAFEVCFAVPTAAPATPPATPPATNSET